MQANQHVIQSYLSQRNYRHSTMVRHKNCVIVFALDAARRLSYTVLNLGGDGSNHDLLAVHARLEQMVPLEFPWC